LFHVPEGFPLGFCQKLLITELSEGKNSQRPIDAYFNCKERAHLSQNKGMFFKNPFKNGFRKKILNF
jgi:hypothetical protein